MKMLPLVFLSVCFCVCGADFYVDASVSTSGNGSQAAPFATIKAAVDAANLLPGTPSTIHVASGIYNITAASDLVTVSVSNLTITAENLSDKPVLALDANLSVATNNPVLITVPIGSDCLTVSGLAFTYSYAASKNAAGNTFFERILNALDEHQRTRNFLYRSIFLRHQTSSFSFTSSSTAFVRSSVTFLKFSSRSFSGTYLKRPISSLTGIAASLSIFTPFWSASLDSS